MTAHPIDTEALRRLADAATPGPWVQNGRNGIHTPIGSCVALTHRHDPEQRQDDAEFIAAAREAVPALLDALAAAEHRATRAEAQSEARRINAEYWKEEAVTRGISFREARAERDQNLEDLGKAEARIRAVRAVLDQHHDQTADGLWLDINDHIPGGDLGDPDMPCGRGVCALGDGHPGPCRC